MPAVVAVILTIHGCGSSALAPSLPSDMPAAAAPDLSSNCPPGTGDCDGDPNNGCETLTIANTKHCGDCGVQCGGAAPICSGGHCRALPNVLLLNESFADLQTDVQQKLIATGAFSAVDIFDTGTAVPTAEALMKYGVVLAWDTGAQEDPAQEPLAAYFLAGGRVVVADATVIVASGAFIPYMTLRNTGDSRVITGDGLGAILDPGSLLMAGVQRVDFTIQAVSRGKIVSGASAIANWRTGEPFVVTGIIHGRRRVDLNFPPWSHDVDDQNGWIGDGATLIKNALLYE